MMPRKRSVLRVCLVATLLALYIGGSAALTVQAAGGVTIDDFNGSDQTVLVWPELAPAYPDPGTDTNPSSDATILGGYRTLNLDRYSDSGLLSVSSTASESNIALTSGDDVTGVLEIIWDGHGTAYSEDLNGAAEAADRFLVYFEEASAGIVLAVEVTDGDGTVAANATALGQIDTAEVVPLLFSTFVDTAPGSTPGIDWNDITSVRLVLDTSLAPRAYATIGLVETSDSTPTAVEQLSLSGAGNSIQILIGTVVAAGALVIARAKTEREN